MCLSMGGEVTILKVREGARLGNVQRLLHPHAAASRKKAVLKIPCLLLLLNCTHSITRLDEHLPGCSALLGSI
jgi:hypothetical protein